MPPNFCSFHLSFSPELGASETRTLGRNVSTPSSEAVKRMYHPILSGLSRRSYHITPTTPSRFTATTGRKASGPGPASFEGELSLTAVGFDQLLPRSFE